MRAAALALVAVSIAGCATPPPPPPPPKPQYTERVILLPSRDGRATGVVVKRATGDRELSTPYQGIDLAGGKEQPAIYTEAEVDRRYGGLLRAQPARPVSFTLFFVSGTTNLTPQSRAALDQVRDSVKAFPAAQVSVIGHTDRVGTSEANDALSLKRAGAIRDLLIEIGVARDAIEVVGRGEREPLVQTADGKAEERNRRVEIKLR